MITGQYNFEWWSYSSTWRVVLFENLSIDRTALEMINWLFFSIKNWMWMLLLCLALFSFYLIVYLQQFACIVTFLKDGNKLKHILWYLECCRCRHWRSNFFWPFIHWKKNTLYQDNHTQELMTHYISKYKINILNKINYKINSKKSLW